MVGASTLHTPDGSQSDRRGSVTSLLSAQSDYFPTVAQLLAETSSAPRGPMAALEDSSDPLTSSILQVTPQVIVHNVEDVDFRPEQCRLRCTNY